MATLDKLTLTSKIIRCLLVFSVGLQALGLGQVSDPPPRQPGQLAEDIGWPRQVTKDGNTLIYYQPQIDEWKKYKELYGNVAFQLTQPGGKPVMGVASLKASTDVNKDTRTVYFRDIDVTSVRMPSLDPKAAEPLEKLVKKLLPHSGEPISVDRVVADLDQDKVDAQGVAVNNTPPPIFYSNVPAVLLMVNGKPVLAPIEKTNLQFVVNTNWDVFFDKKSNHFYILVENGWLMASSLTGPWSHTVKLPADFTKLPAGQNFDAVKKFVPPPPPSGTAYSVIYSDKPAELILTKGSPIYAQVPKTHLLYVTNTDNDLFLDDATRQLYVLLSGRWFRSTALGGPWTFASNDLPAEFSKIPETSPKARVLASVPGTIQAKDAVLLAQIPTTAVVNKQDAEAKINAQGVHYDGQPKFVPIEKTKLQYAENTQDKVIKDGDLYYLCFQGVWFMSTKPNGPWKTADSVPSEIYTIPSSSPLYNVTYVTQTSPTATTVESSTAAGYFGMFVVGMAAGLTIAYGTGYYWPPYIYYPPGMIYPVYRPWPYSYGAGYVYNPWNGGWAAGRTAYGPYGAAGSSAWFNPATGRYGRSASVQGWYGGRTVASSYNPWTGGYGATSQGHNAYAQWGQSAAVRGNQWVQTGHVSTANGTLAGYRGSNGQGVAYRGANGTVARNGNYTYAGHDGNVYRHDSSGNWSQYNNGSWNTVDTSAARQQAQQKAQNARQQWQAQPHPNVSSDTMQRLNNSAASRQRGQFQTQRFQNFQRFGGGRFRR
jgi:hypothetical protein